MTSNKILRKKPAQYFGFLPMSIAKTTFEPNGVLRKLLCIPPKISAHFDVSKVAEVFRSDHAPRREDNYYIIRAIDGTLFHVEY